MRTLRAITAVAILSASIATAPSAWASAPGYGKGSLGPGAVRALGGELGHKNKLTQTSPGATASDATHSDASGDVWTDLGPDPTVACKAGQPISVTGPVYGLGNGAPGTTGLGELYELVGPDGNVLETSDVCPGAAAPATARRPPAPPTPVEVWARTPLPVATFGLNPSTLGLTQLATWFWLTGVGGPVTATVKVRGYTVTTTARPMSYDWSFGDGDQATGTSAGTAAVPSVTHTYVRKGAYRVELTIGWSGQYTFVGNGVAPRTVPLPTVNGAPRAVAYGVQEVRSVGTGG
jgi:hypothetical protein